jgi:hypothetical protein
VVLGLAAWVMGHGDRKKIAANQMDQDGSGLVTAGWICGIIGTFANLLIGLSCLGFFGYVFVDQNNRPSNTYKQPAQFKSKDQGNIDEDPLDGKAWDKGVNRNKGPIRQRPVPQPVKDKDKDKD